MFTLTRLGPVSLAFPFLSACGLSDGDALGAGDQDLSSNEANFYDFAFSGSVNAGGDGSDQAVRKAITTQFFYLMGDLTINHRANSQAGFADLTNIDVTPGEGGVQEIRYEARVPVAWPSSSSPDLSHDITLPSSVEPAALGAFNEKYDGTCGRSEYGVDAFWHDMNPSAEGCVFDDADVIRTTAAVSPSQRSSKSQYPEYDRMLADDRFEAVVLFLPNESYVDADIGVQWYRSFIKATSTFMAAKDESKAGDGYDIYEDHTLRGEVAGIQVVVTALLVSEPSTLGAVFDDRYGPISESADTIMYDGHSGLSKHILALASKGTVMAGKYQLVVMNGCNTFAYLDNGIHERRVEANDDDPTGTKYLDLIVNALPAPFSGEPGETALIQSLLRKASFSDLLSVFPPDQIAIVSGEEDNVYTP